MNHLSTNKQKTKREYISFWKLHLRRWSWRRRHYEWDEDEGGDEGDKEDKDERRRVEEEQKAIPSDFGPDESLL